MSEPAVSPLSAAGPPLMAADSPLMAANLPLASALVASRPRSATPQGALDPPGHEFFARTLLLQEDILRELGRARALSFRPVGSTSTVFRTSLESPLRAAFKARTWRRPGGPLAEIAVYRLSRCLGLSNVPPALFRRVAKRDLQRKLDTAFLAQWPELEDQLLAGADGFVDGAAIFWIDGMRDLGLEPGRESARVLAWLQIGAEIPANRRTLATQLSTLFAFDYLIGNWDRWSGGNLKGDEAGELLYMRDHDAALANRIGEPLQRRMLEPVNRTQRYSRSFVTAVRTLSREAYERELASDPGLSRRPILDPRAMTALFDRRDTLLTHVAALIEEHGEQQVLAFP